MNIQDTKILRNALRQMLLTRSIQLGVGRIGIGHQEELYIPKCSQSITQYSPTTLIRYSNKNTYRFGLSFTRFMSTHNIIPTPSNSKDTPHSNFNAQLTDELQLILNKSSQTKNNLERIGEILKILIKQNEAVSNNYREKCLVLFLRYKMYAIFEEIYNSITKTNTTDEYLLVQYCLMKGKLSKIRDLTLNWDQEKLQKLLLFTSHFMTIILIRPLKLFYLWVFLSLQYSSDLPKAYREDTISLSSILPSILSRNTDITKIHSIVRGLVEDVKIRQVILVQISRSFLSADKPYVLQKFWDATDDKTSTIIGGVITDFLSVKQLRYGYDFYLHNEKYWNSEIQDAITPALPIIGPNPNATAVATLVKKECICIRDVTLSLKTLLYSRRFSEFDRVIEALDKSNLKRTLGTINTEMVRSTFDSNNDDVLKYFKNIYKVQSKPDSKTFEILFQEFAKFGDMKAALSLLDLLLKTPGMLNINHFDSLVATCMRTQDYSHIDYIIDSLKKTNLEPNNHFINSLMNLYYFSSQYKMVEQIFFEYNSRILPNARAYHILMKSYFVRNLMASAHVTFSAMQKNILVYDSYKYAAEIDYYSYQGLFVDALDILTKAEEHGNSIAVYYISLINNYTRFGKYEEAIMTFNAALNKGHNSETGLYKALVKALVKLNVINRGNYQRPIEIIDGLIKSQNAPEQKMNNHLSFAIIRPLVESLIRFYRPEDAKRIMSNFLTVNPQYEIDQRLNYMKVDMNLAAASRKWKNYEVLFNKFQERIKGLLDADGLAPCGLKKVYNGFIKSLYQYHHQTGKSANFSALFHDLLFVHDFTFSSNNLNWIALRFIRKRETFLLGMKIIEKKLIGGKIGRNSIRRIRYNAMRKHLHFSPFNYNGNYIKPSLSLGHIAKLTLEKKVYDFAINKKDKTIVNQLIRSFPRTMKNVKAAHKRLKRKEVYLAKKSAASLTQKK